MKNHSENNETMEMISLNLQASIQRLQKTCQKTIKSLKKTEVALSDAQRNLWSLINNEDESTLAALNTRVLDEALSSIGEIIETLNLEINIFDDEASTDEFTQEKNFEEILAGWAYGQQFENLSSDTPSLDLEVLLKDNFPNTLKYFFNTLSNLESRLDDLLKKTKDIELTREEALKLRTEYTGLNKAHEKQEFYIQNFQSSQKLLSQTLLDFRYSNNDSIESGIFLDESTEEDQVVDNAQNEKQRLKEEKYNKIISDSWDQKEINITLSSENEKLQKELKNLKKNFNQLRDQSHTQEKHFFNAFEAQREKEKKYQEKHKKLSWRLKEKEKEYTELSQFLTETYDAMERERSELISSNKENKEKIKNLEKCFSSTQEEWNHRQENLANEIEQLKEEKRVMEQEVVLLKEIVSSLPAYNEPSHPDLANNSMVPLRTLEEEIERARTAQDEKIENTWEVASKASESVSLLKDNLDTLKSEENKRNIERDLEVSNKLNESQKRLSKEVDQLKKDLSFEVERLTDENREFQNKLEESIADDNALIQEWVGAKIENQSSTLHKEWTDDLSKEALSVSGKINEISHQISKESEFNHHLFSTVDARYNSLGMDIEVQKSQIHDLKNTLTRQNDTLKLLHEEGMETFQKIHEIFSTHDQETSELNDALHEISFNTEQFQAKVSQHLDRLDNAYETVINQKESLTSALKKLEEEIQHLTEQAPLNEDHKKEFEQLEAICEDITLLREKLHLLEEQIKQQNTAHEELLQGVQDINKQNKAFELEQQAELENLKHLNTQLNEKFEKLETKHAHQLKTLGQGNSQNTDDIRILEDQFSTKLETLEEEIVLLRKQKNLLQEKHQEQEALHENQMVGLSASFTKQIETLSHQHTHELEELEISFAEKIECLSKALNDKEQKLDEYIKDGENTLSETIKIFEDEKLHLRTEFDEQIKYLQEENTYQRKAYQEQIEHLTAQFEKQLKILKKEDDLQLKEKKSPRKKIRIHEELILETKEKVTSAEPQKFNSLILSFGKQSFEVGNLSSQGVQTLITRYQEYTTNYAPKQSNSPETQSFENFQEFQDSSYFQSIPDTKQKSYSKENYPSRIKILKFKNLQQALEFIETLEKSSFTPEDKEVVAHLKQQIKNLSISQNKNSFFKSTTSEKEELQDKSQPSDDSIFWDNFFEEYSSDNEDDFLTEFSQ